MFDGEDHADPSPAPAPVSLSADAQQVLRLVLGLDPSVAAGIRAGNGSRARPRRQTGPSADYGDAAAEPT